MSKFNEVAESVDKILSEGAQNYSLDEVLGKLISKLEDLNRAVKGGNGSDDPSLKNASAITKPTAVYIKELKKLKKDFGSEDAWFRELY